MKWKYYRYWKIATHFGTLLKTNKVYELSFNNGSMQLIAKGSRKNSKMKNSMLFNSVDENDKHVLKVNTENINIELVSDKNNVAKMIDLLEKTGLNIFKELPHKHTESNNEDDN